MSIQPAALVADLYGNARCFGPGVSPLETAMASRRIIVSADEIIDPDDVRTDPGKTTIPYYMVGAVVYSPFGAYPGVCPGSTRWTTIAHPGWRQP